MEGYGVYVGTKIVKAKYMSKERFEAQKNDCECRQGNEEGYKVIYEDGYESWSPKDTFERCYRELTASERKMV